MQNYVRHVKTNKTKTDTIIFFYSFIVKFLLINASIINIKVILYLNWTFLQTHIIYIYF